jgi:hypothetical protein
VAFATSAGLVHAARATTDVTIVGFGAGTTATGATAVYYDPNAPVPASPTAELDGAYSTAALQSGPIGRALSSVAWPGDLVAGAGPALGLLLPVNPGLGPYPVRAQASFPQGSAAQRNDSVAGSEMVASASRAGVAASAESGRADGGAALVDGAITSAVQARSTPTAVELTGQAHATGVSILGGLVRFASVSTQTTLRTDGVKPRLSGTTSVVGLTVAGTPLTVDGSGVRLGGAGTGAGDATDAAESLLRSVGVSLQVAQPIDLVSASHAERSMGGLIVGLDAKAIAGFLSTVSAPTAQEIAAVLNPQQTLVLSFGSVGVTATTITQHAVGLGPLGSAPSVGATAGPSGAATKGTTAVGPAGGGAPEGSSAGRVSDSAPPTSAGPVSLASGTTAAGPGLLGVPAAYHGIRAKDWFVAAVAIAVAAALLWGATKRVLLLAAAPTACEHGVSS